MELHRHHALVTGGGSGIGAAIARALSAAGASVTVLGRSETKLADMVAQGAAAGSIVCDVTVPSALAAAVIEVEKTSGPLSILVNNAGAVETAPLAKLDRGMWDRMLTLNLTAVFEGCQAVLPGMLARRYGRIVNIASTAGLKGYPYVSAYCAAKHGVIGLTRALALETARSGVTVNAVCPGYTETDLVDGSVGRIAGKTGRTPEEIRAGLAAASPQNRLITPDEAAAAVLFLCRKDAGAMTGQAIAVAGGEVM